MSYPKIHKLHTFNTGRGYAKNGQAIRWAIIEKGEHEAAERATGVQ